MGNLKKREKILLFVLISAVSIFLLDMFVLSSDEEKQPPKRTKLDRVDATKETPKESDKKQLALNFPIKNKANRIMAVHKIDPELLTTWKRDPFLGAFTTELLDSLQEKPPEDFILKAISWRDSVAYVILNDDVYREGESKNGVHVIDVIGERVYFSYNGKRKVISFGESNEN